MDIYNENAIEFLNDGKSATCTFTRIKFKNRILKLAEERPEEVEIVSVNKDGSVCARVPIDWVKIRPSRLLTEEQATQLAERGKRLAEARGK